jgi:hypothetical protein
MIEGITVVDAIKRKRELESRLAADLLQFQNDTGVYVTGVYIQGNGRVDVRVVLIPPTGE